MTDITVNLDDLGRVKMGRNDYDEIEKQANHSVVPTEITEALFDYLLNVLPPFYGPKGTRSGSYFMSEFLTGDITLQFVRGPNGKYYAKYVNYSNPATFIDPKYFAIAHYVDPNDADGYA